MEDFKELKDITNEDILQTANIEKPSDFSSSEETTKKKHTIISNDFITRFCFASRVTCIISLIAFICISIGIGHLILSVFMADICNDIKSDKLISFYAYFGCFLYSRYTYPINMTFGLYILSVFTLFIQYNIFIWINFIIICLFVIICIIIIIILTPFLIILCSPCLFCLFLIFYSHF